MRKIVFLVIGIIMIGFCLTFPHSSATGDETLKIPLWVEATYRIDFVNMTTMNVSATFCVHEICIDETNYTADAIRENYTFYPAVGWDIINKTIQNIDNVFNSTIKKAFTNDTLEKCENTTVDETSLVEPPVGPASEYHPPINFTKNATITFNMVSFGFEENPQLRLDDVLRGVLKMGAVINKTFELKADAGYKNTFILTVPRDIKIVGDDEDNSDEKATWTVDNKNASSLEEQPLTAEGKLTIESRNKTYIQDEEILTSVTIDMINFDNLHINGTVDIKSVNVKKYNISFPEEYIKNLSFVSSDGIRMALENGLVEWADVERQINNITKGAEETLNSTFNTTITISFDEWYNMEGYNLSEMGSARAINATFNALNESGSEKIKPNIFGDFDAETITGVLNAGAKISFEISKAEQNYIIKMILPENMIFSGYSQKVEHTIITNRNTYSWSSSETLSCTLESGIAPEYNESMALLNVLVDIHNIDIFGMMLSIDLTADAQVYHIELSDVDMPKNITIKYINSDCLRLLYAKNIIKQSDIDNITNEIKKSLEENLTNSLGGNVSISICIDPDSLAGYDVNNMRDDRPVKISAEAHISISLEQASPGKQAMTISYLTFPLEFPLSGMEGFNTTYTIIFPKGIDVINATDTRGRLQHGTTKDGRTYLTVTLNENEEDTISIIIDVTGLVLNIILPFIILGLILTVVGIVVRLMRRKEGKLE
ncbi:MAG: hypothetical protein QMC80_04465 [Thermoplasmatales archaeon]|nr:hypothetical protein [Thermoplasmatales archaeon]